MTNEAKSSEAIFDLETCNLYLAIFYGIPIANKSIEPFEGHDAWLKWIMYVIFMGIIAGIVYAFAHYIVSFLMRKAYQLTAGGLQLNFNKAVANEMIACGVCAAITYKISTFLPETLSIGDVLTIKTWFLSSIIGIIIIITQFWIVCKKQPATIFQAFFLIMIPTFTPITIMLGIAYLAIKF